MKKSVKTTLKKPAAGRTIQNVRFSTLSREDKKTVAEKAATRFWKDYGTVIERLAKE